MDCLTSSSSKRVNGLVESLNYYMRAERVVYDGSSEYEGVNSFQLAKLLTRKLMATLVGTQSHELSGVAANQAINL